MKTERFPRQPLRNLVVDVTTGWQPKGADKADTQAGVVLAKDVLSAGVVSTDNLDPQAVPGAAVARYSIRPGDVVMVGRGSSGAFRAGCVAAAPANAIISSNLMRVRLREDLLLGEVLVAFLSSSEIQSALKARSAGVATFSLTRDQVNALEIPLPPMDVQHAIAELWRATHDCYQTSIKAAESRRALGLGIVNVMLAGAALPDLSAMEVGHVR